MDWVRALSLSIQGYFAVFAILAVGHVAGLPAVPIHIGTAVFNFFVVLFVAYTYFKKTGIDTTNDVFIFGVLWLGTSVVLDLILFGVMLGRGLAHLGELGFWVYYFERLLVPLITASLIEMKTTGRNYHP